MKSVVFHHLATAEFDEAAEWYERQRQGLGADFRSEAEAALRRIQANPNYFPLYTRPGYRKCFIRRFPYTIIFAEFDNAIWISAFAHQRRRPGYWNRRKPP